MTVEKVALITAAGKGMGAAIARELAAMEELDEPKAQEKILDILRAAAAIYNKDKVPA